MVKIIKPFISHILELKRGMWAGKISESAIASKRYKNSAMGLFEKRHIKHMDNGHYFLFGMFLRIER